jgi:hypothetical protein
MKVKKGDAFIRTSKDCAVELKVMACMPAKLAVSSVTSRLRVTISSWNWKRNRANLKLKIPHAR